jgi:hypothetical protein
VIGRTERKGKKKGERKERGKGEEREKERYFSHCDLIGRLFVPVLCHEGIKSIFFRVTLKIQPPVFFAFPNFCKK